MREAGTGREASGGEKIDDGIFYSTNGLSLVLSDAARCDFAGVNQDKT